MRRLTLAAVVVLVPGGLLLPVNGLAAARPAVQVSAAYDLFQTIHGGTHYGPVHFSGVAGCKLFPAAVHTDTIVQRTRAVTPARPSTPIEAKCLQLKGEYLDMAGASPLFEPLPSGLVGIGGKVELPVKEIFVTLQSDRGRHPDDAAVQARAPGKRSLGDLRFTFNRKGCGGTFDSDLLVYFDVRRGSINGPIVYSVNDDTAPFFHSYDTPWGCSASRASVGFVDAARGICVGNACVINDEHKVGAPSDLLRGVNFQMNGRNGSADFFPMQFTA
jgi:hypothetical protein